jgi:hypothetical protein
MKWKTLLFLLVLIAVTSFFRVTVFAAEIPVFVEQYALGVNAPAGLWNLRAQHGKNYRQANTWQEFKQFTCAHSGISIENCTDVYLSNLKKGTIVAIPATRVFVQVPEGVKAPEVMSLIPAPNDQKLLVPMMSVIPSIAVDNTLPLKAELAALRSLHQRTDLLFKSTVGYVIVLMIALFLFQKRLSRKEHELTVKNERIFALMERVKTIAFTMPPFAVHETKGTEVILPVASVDGNGEPFVAPEWTPHPMKLSQLESFMYRAFLKNEVLPHVQWKLGKPESLEDFEMPTCSSLHAHDRAAERSSEDVAKLGTEDRLKDQFVPLHTNTASEQK